MRALRQKYIAEFVYGAIDGIVTTFAVVSGVLGASLSPAIVLILGFANLFADGFSMAVSNYLSERSRQDLEANHHGTESVDRHEAVITASITFGAFVVIGFVPLISFVFAPISPFLTHHTFTVSAVLAGVAFVFVGLAKGYVTRTSYLYSAVTTLAIGGAAAVIAFGVGYLLRGFA